MAMAMLVALAAGHDNGTTMTVSAFASSLANGREIRIVRNYSSRMATTKVRTICGTPPRIQRADGAGRLPNLGFALDRIRWEPAEPFTSQIGLLPSAQVSEASKSHHTEVFVDRIGRSGSEALASRTAAGV
jgi:hypothetical protein